MAARTACVHCGRVGFVRKEHIIERGGAARVQCYCGICDRSWFLADERHVPDRRGEANDHARLVVRPERRVTARRASDSSDGSTVDREQLFKRVEENSRELRRLADEVRRLRKQIEDADRVPSRTSAL